MAFLWAFSCFTLLGAVLGCGTHNFHSKMNSMARIVNGVKVRPGSWPWHVSLQEGNSDVSCGGSLISDNWVVTAAHCNVTESSVVLAGLDNRPTNWGNIQILKVAQVFRHPSHYPGSVLNDISLLKLATPAHISPRVSPVCLPKVEDNFPPGTKCVITGWGVPDPKAKRNSNALQEASLPLLPMSECKKYWGAAATDDMICAGANGVTTSKGDSGGPLVCSNKGTWNLVGILSYSSTLNSTDKPILCPRVTSLLPWIQETIAKYQALIPPLVNPYPQ